MSLPASLLEPATAMPVPAEIRSLMGHDHDVSHTSFDDGFAPGTDVFLARLVRLDRLHHLVGELAEKINHVRGVGSFGCHRKPWYEPIPQSR